MINYIIRNSLIILSIFSVTLLIRWIGIESSIQPEANCILCVLAIIGLICIFFVLLFYYLINRIKLNDTTKHVIAIAVLILGYLAVEYILLRSIHYLLVNNYLVWKESVSAVGLREIVEKSNVLFFLSFIFFEAIKFFMVSLKNKRYLITGLVSILLISSVSLLVINTFNLFRYV